MNQFSCLVVKPDMFSEENGGMSRADAVPAKPLIGIMWRQGPFACIPSQNRIPSAT